MSQRGTSQVHESHANTRNPAVALPLTIARRLRTSRRGVIGCLGTAGLYTVWSGHPLTLSALVDRMRRPTPDSCSPPGSGLPWTVGSCRAARRREALAVNV